MPHATTDDGVKLYYEEAGSGTPIIFSHEFAGDYRNWEPQMRHFARRHRCITYSARGYTPSDVPNDWKNYSYKHWVDDVVAVLDHLITSRPGRGPTDDGRAKPDLVAPGGDTAGPPQPPTLPADAKARF